MESNRLNEELSRIMGVDLTTGDVEGFTLTVQGGLLPQIDVRRVLFQEGKVLKQSVKFELKAVDEPKFDLDALVLSARSRLEAHVKASVRLHQREMYLNNYLREFVKDVIRKYSESK